MEDSDAQLHLKKRARRRLVGAVAFVLAVAVVLPMIMDQEPRPVAQDVEIRIPGQDEKPFAPKFAVAPVDKPAPAVEDRPVEAPVPPAEKAAPKAEPPATAVPPVQGKPTAVVLPPEKPSAKPEKAPEKAAEKASIKPAEPSSEKAVAKETKDNASEARRAAAILAGKGADPAPPAKEAKGGEQVILIGAFTNEANVKSLRGKLGEIGVKAYTEPLDTPQGKKTRVRAGPFPNREAAEKALEKMKRIGVSGVIAAR